VLVLVVGLEPFFPYDPQNLGDQLLFNRSSSTAFFGRSKLLSLRAAFLGPPIHFAVARAAVPHFGWNRLRAQGAQPLHHPPMTPDSPLFVQITDAVLDPAPLVRFVEAPEMGAVVTFSGNVRNHNRGRTVEYLEYDAYRPMAERELRRIGEEALERWNCRIALQHRVGRLEVGEPSVLVVVACAHRGDAFEACRWAIDTLKERVPIWKREVWEGGEVWIEGERDAPVSAEDA
jgi:molybdopterin synthase catalytic subunit